MYPTSRYFHNFATTHLQFLNITGQISETPVLSQNINDYVGHSWYIVNKCCFDFDNIKIIIVQSHFEKGSRGY